MAYTTDPHKEEERLPKQERSEFNRRSLGDVRQDNIASLRERIGLPQALRQQDMARTRQTSKNSDRSKKHSTKRQTVSAVGWVPKPISLEIDRIAGCDGLTRSKTIANLLTEAVRQRLHTQHAVLLTAVVEQAIAKQMAKERARIAALLVRIAFDANQTRTLATNILGRQVRMNPAKLTTILEASYRKAKMDITRRSPQIESLIKAVENWLDGGEPEGEPAST
jgi:hypothetical protein